MSRSTVTLNFREPRGLIIVIAAALAAATLAWFGVRWQLGSMISELTPPGDPNAKYAAVYARSFAPHDPLGAWLNASTGSGMVSTAGLEDTVRLSPNDYRWWIELGRADEKSDRIDLAELAFDRAAAIAPHYVYPRWHLGNFLLRQGRPEEAFAELKLTTENNLSYREQVFSLAWDYFDHDPAKLEAVVADSPDARASLALFYAAHGQAADSLRIWNLLTDDQKAEDPQTARTIAQALTEKQFFRQGLEFSRQVGLDPDAEFQQVTNGGFERPLGDPDDNYYGWNVERGEGKLDIAADPSVKHSGNRSLRVTFRTYVKPELSNPWEYVTVQPGANYDLRFWVRTENLRSAGPPQIEILRSNEFKLIAASPPFPTGTNDWQEMSITFKAPDDSDGVSVRLARSYCGDACPLVGIIWLDDLTLSRK
jgi:tetratricopeptide (TPR) repeat protein